MPFPAAPAAPETPPTPPPAAPATPPIPAQPDPKAAGRGSRIFNLLAQEAEVEPGAKPKEKEPVKPVTPPVDDKKAPVEPVVEDKPIKAAPKKAPISKRPELPKDTPPTPAPVAAPAPSPLDDKAWEEGLVDNEKQLLSDAEEAEKYLPTKKGLKENVRKFIKAHQDYLDKHPELNEEAPEPEAQADYDRWLKKNQPRLSEIEQRTVSEGRISDRVSKPLREQLSTQDHEIFVRDQEPQIKQKSTQVASQLNSEIIPAEILDFATKNGVEEAKKQFVDELQVVQNIVTTASSDYAELNRLGTVNPKNGKPLSLPAADKSDPRYDQHQRLGEVIAKACEDFKAAAKSEADLKRDGKWFVSRDEWNALPAAHRAGYWTFDNKEIADRMLTWCKPAVLNAIKVVHEDMGRRGWERRKFAPAAPPAVPPQPSNSPGPTPTPVPAPSGNPGAPQTAGHRLASVLSQA